MCDPVYIECVTQYASVHKDIKRMTQSTTFLTLLELQFMDKSCQIGWEVQSTGWRPVIIPTFMLSVLLLLRWLLPLHSSVLDTNLMLMHPW